MAYDLTAGNINPCLFSMFGNNFSTSNKQDDKSGTTIPFSGLFAPDISNNNYLSSLIQFNLFLNSLKIPGAGMFADAAFSTKTNLSQLKNVYSPQIGKTLAGVAYKNAMARSTRGYCFRGVRTSLELAGLSQGEIRGQSAYQAAGLLAKHKNFAQVNVAKSDLHNLPAGCVIVWDRGAGHPNGHITVTLGNGKSASDHLENKVDSMHTNFAVFVPVSRAGHFNQKV